MSKLEKYWHGLFEFGILVKGFNGVWETISGILVLFFSKTMFTRFFFFLVRGELLEDPHDRVVAYVANSLQGLSSDVKIFAAVYILVHGLLNVFLAIQLYRNRLWAYLVTITSMLIFISYQIYRISVHHSHVLMLITLFDFLFVLLTWHEYRYRLSVQS